MNRVSSTGTAVIPADDDDAIARAVALLHAGGLVAFPTDTVYGVAALAWDGEAVDRLYEAKGRARGKAIPLLLADVAVLSRPGRDIAHMPPQAEILARQFWPGPLTLVVPRGAALPAAVTAGGDTVAVRVPDHPVALALLQALGEPLAATSANRSSHASPLTAAGVQVQLGGRIDLILDGGACPGGIDSTVVDVTVDPIRILRQGPVTAEMLARAFDR